MPCSSARARLRLASPARRRDQTRDRDGVARADLAGKPHVRRRVDAGKRHRLGGGRRRQVAEAAVDPDPAGGAARPPAAHGGVRHVVHAADLEQRRPRRDPNHRPATIGHLHPGAGGPTHDPHHRHQQSEAEQPEEGLRRPVVQRDQRAPRCCVGRARGGLQPAPCAGLGNLRRHLPAGHREAGQRRHRQRDRQREQQRAHLRDTRAPGSASSGCRCSRAPTRTAAAAAAPARAPARCWRVRRHRCRRCRRGWPRRGCRRHA